MPAVNSMRHLALITGFLLSAAAFAQPAATVTVDAARPLHPIPRSIYGTFLEPIGNSTYGGLWAQILSNPSFEENLWSAARVRQMVNDQPDLVTSSGMGLPLPWQPLDARQGWRYEPRWNDAANSARSLLIMALPGVETGVRQEVFLPVHRVARYTGSLYVKAVEGRRAVEVSLRGRNQAQKRVLASDSGVDRRRLAETRIRTRGARGPPAIPRAGRFRHRHLRRGPRAHRPGRPLAGRSRRGHEPGDDRDVARPAHPRRTLRRQLHLGLSLPRRSRPYGQARQHAEPVLGHPGVQHLRHR